MATLKTRSELDSKPFQAGIGKMGQSVEGFEKKLGGVKKTIASAFTAGAFAGLVKGAFEASAAFETMEQQFAILLGDMDMAKAVMADLKKFSAETPFQLEDIAAATRQLFIFSDGAIQGTEELRRIGDAAAATGNDIKEAICPKRWINQIFELFRHR